MTATQTVSVDVTLDCEIEARGQLTDYGVRGSPRWVEYDPTGWSRYTVDIAGVTVRIAELPENLQEALWECAIEAIDDNAWNEEERDYE